MLGKKMEAALNEQINKEIYSAYLYLSMSAHSTHIGLKGFANWFMVQYQEEMVHAMKFYTYINDQGGQVRLMAIDAPAIVWESIKEKDHATNIALQWFITEQIEEESNDNDIIAKLKLVGSKGDALLMLDRELAARVFIPPATSQAV